MLQQAGSVIKEALSWSYQKIEDTYAEQKGVWDFLT